MKEPITEAISQHTRNQQQDGIRHLYVYSQLLLSVATLQAKYATTDTKEEFWSAWKEQGDKGKEALKQLINVSRRPQAHNSLKCLNCTH